MKSKRILLIGGNYYPEPTGIGKYNGEMMDELANKGYECTVVTSYPYYPYWKIQKPYTFKSIWYKKEFKKTSNRDIVIYRCPQYVPKNPTGLKRLMLDFSFFISCFLKIFQLLFAKKFDYVITVVPSFHLGLLAVMYKKLRGAKFFYHVQDLQIEAAKELNMIRSKLLIGVLLKTEKYILKQADIVSSISEGMIKKINDKCQKDILLFPNWVDTGLFFPIPNKGPLKEEFGFAADNLVILYSGAIGEKQGLEIILHAAKSLEINMHLKFVICGSGPYKQKLTALAAELNLNNLVFLPLQPKEKLNHFLNMADIHLIIQKANASDLVMPSKLTTILSVGGVAIVTATEGTSLYRLIKSNKIGVVIDPENTCSLVQAIQKTLKLDHYRIHTSARKYAEEFLARDGVISRFTLNMSL